jgi:hypothetical protein
MKNGVFLAFFALLSQFSFGQYSCQSFKSTSGAFKQNINNNAKSDTIDITHYHIDFDATKIVSKDIKARTDITFFAKLSNVQFMELDLLKLQIDSITPSNLVSGYSYNDTILGVHFSTSLTQNDTQTISVYYHGEPQGDATNWGGFHYNNPYFFNLGVGFGANPHTYGRAWFPCFDNFVEKSTYSFSVKTEGGRKAYCNGIRTSITQLQGDTIISNWSLNSPIPTYLASVGMSNYEEISYTHSGLPFMLMARAADTTKLKNSFTNVTQTYDSYVNAFGPYFWEKMGYVLTTQGAMEHATSIHYPRSLVNGSSLGEDIMAHEMAHHWWGNLITCETAGDMWINEGMTEFASHLYEETVYSKERYLETVRDNAALVIQFAAVNDNGHLALHGVDHENTYGTHTYQKGALIGHNLRGYIGDSLFFNGVKQLLSQNKYGNLNANQFRDQLTAITGYNLNSFFDDWIFQPGYAQLGIDSMEVVVTPLPEKTVTVGISQRQRAAIHAFTNIPFTITYFHESGMHETRSFVYTNQDAAFTTQIPFTPEYAVINYNDEVLLGTTSNEVEITQTGPLDLKRALMKLNVINHSDTSLLRVEHNWAGPEGKNPMGFKLSSSRYWRIMGNLSPSFDATANLNYNSLAQNGGLDADLLSHSEDSLLLLFRNDSRDPWLEYPFYQKNILNNSNNGFGRMELSKVLVGEYVFANGVSSVGIKERKAAKINVKIYPNPADSILKIETKKLKEDVSFFIFNAQGLMVTQGLIEKHSGKSIHEISTNKLSAGAYILSINNSTSATFIVER